MSATNSEVVMICPELAPGSGGVADYILQLVREWRGQIPLRFILPATAEIPADFPHPVEVMEKNRAALLDKLPARGGKVLLQYSAYGFDHYGYPRWLLRAVREWKQKSGGLLVIMLHEIWAFWPWWNKNYFLQEMHRRELRRLIPCADELFTTTSGQAEDLRKLYPQKTARVLPVGSNFSPATDSIENRQPGLAVLLGLQPARIHALRKMQGELAALTANNLTRIETIGTGNTEAGDRAEEELLRNLALQKGFKRCGALPAEEVATSLARASFAISAQPAHSITKSGTFMAYAAHGLTILSLLGDQPDAAEPVCWLTHPLALSRGLSAETLHARGKNLREWQKRIGSWSVTAQQFAEALQVG